MVEKVKSVFEQEFGVIREKFAIKSLCIEDAKKSQDLIVINPGVYIFWKDADIIKVGRSFTNSRKRSLEHIRDNTKNEAIEMKSLVNEDNCGIILINCISPQDYHWIAAIEIYLEKWLKPLIKSKRTG